MKTMLIVLLMAAIVLAAYGGPAFARTGTPGREARRYSAFAVLFLPMLRRA
ncbi:hypothetical protein [Pseudorhodoplanes sp.]|uniref:hypothetical protein n=1 Tax=Pseudorhodoplanes sp. TaxID=1934341 RepID=UPI003D12B1C2